MHDLIARAYAALAAIHPLAPWLALTLAVFAPQYLVRKYRPLWWERFALLGPEAAMASKVWQGLPSVLLGALWAAFASGGDLRAAFYGALAGALAPLKHEMLKRLPNSVVPYVGGSYPAASTAPRKTTTPPVLPLIALLLAPAVASGACGGPAEIVRSPSAACDAGACPVPDAGEQHAGSMPTPPDVIVTPPPQTDVGAVLVVLRTAGGVEHAILCAGEVSSESKGAPVACPYDSDGDAGRTLLKLDRGQP